jgi:hypothetical protein
MPVESYPPTGQGNYGDYGNENYGMGNGHGDLHEEQDEDGYGPIGIKEDG